ncbi:hypothetical protein FHG66_15300 [Rubellimicrobium rubrum]|uniref:Uncharacterized protein n=1 Tax=Rubellimicrobium rubrum TaxID=2585369 RepID=A0A5C4MV70_9RHOB|nr:hypothetical protein [Rubellimicrobium rubrum]TNC48006.1 hypothetical protein FHG66_15300 [Rubellimicrobium rubrum]
MTPDFALSLSFDGIRLLHRSPDGWALLGEVPLDSCDLAGELAALRRAGLAVGAPWDGTKIVLPDEQIRYLTLDNPQASRSDVLAALDGATPYAVSDLVVDHASDGTRTYVAAVARETLEEAEAFAAEHGFQPLCFAALAPEGKFDGEVFFGPTRLAASILGDQPVTRDTTPDPVPSAALAPAELEEETAASPPDLLPSTPRVETVTSEVLPDDPSSDDDTPQIARPSDRVLDVPAPAPEPASLIMTTEPEDDPAGPPPERPAPQEAPPTVAMTAPPAPLSATGVPQPIFASRAKPSPREGREGDAPALGGSTETRRVGPADKRPLPPPLQGPQGLIKAPEGGWALSAPSPAARRDPRVPPAAPSMAAPARREPPVAPAPVRAQEDVGSRPPIASAPMVTRRDAASGQAAGSATSEAARMTVFGARKPEPADRPNGRPRFLALILTVILLIAMAAVAVLASVSEQGLAGLLRRDSSDTGQAATTAAEPPQETADAPKLDSDTPAQQDTAEAGPVEQSTAPAVQPSAAANQAAAAAVAAAIAELPGDADTAGAAEGATAFPAEAPSATAPSGVGSAAPSLPSMPVLGDSPVSTIPSDGSVVTRAGQLPALAAIAPDPSFIPLADIPPATGAPDTAVAEAAPAPTQNPDASSDARVVVEAPAPEPQPSSQPDTPPAASRWVNAMADAPSVQPRLRPERPLDPGEAFVALTPEAVDGAMAAEDDAPATPAKDAATVAPGSVSLVGLRPLPRPKDLAPEAPAEEALAAFDGPVPDPRPEGLVPDLPASPDVTDAVAQALAAGATEPDASPPAEAPAEAPAPDIQSTLATIVANAPDPLAGATGRAVAAARVPGTRPQNFDRVVRNQREVASRAAAPRQQAAEQASAGGVGTRNLQSNEQAESGEPEVASSAAAVPSGPTAASVAQAATYADAMALREMNLIGVYGQPNARRALVRLGNGRYLRVGVGDSLDGGQVTAIGENALNYVRRGRTEVLVIPGS